MTDKYFVIGNPIEHSLSPLIHKEFSRSLGIDLTYEKRLFGIDSFSEELRNLISNDDVKGANVTVPFKVAAKEACSNLSERALRAGAVNTLKFENGEIYGDNTDGAGFVADLESRCRLPLKGARVLILGAGGAARGLLAAITDEGCAQIGVANRTHEKAVRLADEFRIRAVRCEETGQAVWDVVVNATSASITGALPDVNPKALNKARVAYDLFYSKTPTAFMRFASENGCPFVVDGLGMLVEQAAESFLWWRGIRPKTDKVYQWLRML